MNADPARTIAEPQPNDRSNFFAVVALFGAGLAVVIAFFTLAIYVANKDTASAAGSGASGANAPAATTVKATLSDYKITLDQSSIPSGPVNLVVTNTSAIAHNVHIQGLAKTRDLAKGESQTLTLDSLEPGTYELNCDVPGHKDLGMVAKLTVKAGGLATGTKATSDSPSKAIAVSDDPVKIDWKAVDASHERVVRDFLAGQPAKTEGLGNQPLAPVIENGIKVFNLTAKVVQWEVKPGTRYEAWTYNGTVPGPEIRIKQGETVKVRLKNELPESTSIHWHGIEMKDNTQDGVTFVTQDPIQPGATYEYTLTPINCGSHMYHSHHAADAQVPLGLLGALIIDCTTTPVPAFADHTTEYTEVLTDGPLGFGINGKGFPATTPVVTKVGEKTLIRFMNEGLIIHPMHLHGHHFSVVAKDGNYLPAPYDADTLNIAPGERYDVIVNSLYTGAWAFHCHILTHAESPQGLHGMTTVWVVKP